LFVCCEMGLDGGSIPLRIELCKTKQKEEVADKAATRANRFFTCALSGLPLVAPIAMCATGRLYTYENVLTTLLAKPRRELVPELAHLRSKHDVFLIKPTRNPEYTRPATDPVDPGEKRRGKKKKKKKKFLNEGFFFCRSCESVDVSSDGQRHWQDARTLCGGARLRLRRRALAARARSRLSILFQLRCCHCWLAIICCWFCLFKTHFFFL
jgi:hypothetical protein